MAKIKIPKELPDCDFIRILAKKAEERKDVDFDFIGELRSFRKRVSAEARYINLLFPEYTPHDEEYHLKRLFHVACTILARERLESMNCSELFVLAVALYGHDWGMAVSEAEKNYILTAELANGVKGEDLSILTDEQSRLRQFGRDRRWEIKEDGKLQELPRIDEWREYVRQTHAFRSAERVRRFFEPINRGVGEAASRVCQGHWLEFEDLQDYKLYPPDFAVLRETVNLRALAVYLRLIDLLDLADDRTPYVIWKFVAPRDPRSKMEWAKHRALHPVTCPPYQDGRIILVDGGTEDHEVYAALEDLRIWCEEQLRGCNDILARMNDPRHKLDLYRIDWRVAARGFKSVSIQFEFDRERMFEILSDEIYQGDPYVFLRELLQNSIDAIRMRREVLKRKGIDLGERDAIHVKVEHGHGGDAVITWRDEGIGMDEYMVRNYLAVAGKSYYQSADFEREGLKMDPISRFGVGLLSCFVVAYRFEIETFKEPYLPPWGEPLKIVIPAVRRQFRIEAQPEEGVAVGTTVRVFVDGKKIPGDEGGTSPKPLDVTTYLAAVAGFVEFPIVITEGDRKTIVLHPRQDAEVTRKRFGKHLGIHQLALDYPWEEVILPQDLNTASSWFKEKNLDVASDLNLNGYEGTLTYLYPIDDTVDVDARCSWRIDVIVRGAERHPERGMRLRLVQTEHHRPQQASGVSRSSSRFPSFGVYRDGILLPTARPPQSWHLTHRSPMRGPVLVVKLPKSSATRLDLARTHFVREAQPWDHPIFDAHLRHLSKSKLQELLQLDPSERCYQLGRLLIFDHLTPDSLWEVFPKERWPVPFLHPDGQIHVLEWREIANDRIHMFPLFEPYELSKLCHCHWFSKEKYRGALLQWAGEPCVITNTPMSDDFALSESVCAAVQLCSVPIEKTHSFSAIRFLVSPGEDCAPLVQPLWLPPGEPKQPLDPLAILEKAAKHPALLEPAEGDILSVRLSTFLYKFPLVIHFPEPFDQSLAYGQEILNINHRVAQAVVRFAARWRLAELRRDLSPELIGQMEDIVRSFQRGLRSGHSLSDAVQDLCLLATRLQLFSVDEIRNVALGDKDFVPGTAGKDDIDIRRQWRFRKDARPFGTPL